MQKPKQLGVDIRWTSVFNLALASKRRNATCTLGNFEDIGNYHKASWASEECIHDLHGFIWLQGSTLYHALGKLLVRQAFGIPQRFRDLRDCNTYLPNIFS